MKKDGTDKILSFFSKGKKVVNHIKQEATNLSSILWDLDSITKEDKKEVAQDDLFSVINNSKQYNHTKFVDITKILDSDMKQSKSKVKSKSKESENKDNVKDIVQDTLRKASIVDYNTSIIVEDSNVQDTVNEVVQEPSVVVASDDTSIIVEDSDVQDTVNEVVQEPSVVVASDNTSIIVEYSDVQDTVNEVVEDEPAVVVSDNTFIIVEDSDVQDTVNEVVEDEPAVVVSDNVSVIVEKNEDVTTNVFEILNTNSTNQESNLDYSSYLVNSEVSPQTPSQCFEANLNALKVLNLIKDEGRDLATLEEKKILVKYSGAAVMTDKFDKSDTVKGKELLDVLGDNYKSSRSSILTSYYTPAVVSKFMFKVLKRLGFEKGKILECSCGVGKILSYMEEDMYYDSDIHGVEIDTVSSEIAKLLHPTAKIQNRGFENTEYKDDMFDVCISNVPFADVGVFDNQDKDLNSYSFKLHDYFFAKALKKVRPGGIIAFITHSGTMDKKSEEFRKYISDRGNLIGAIRLPKEVFINVSTDTDIIFIQKKDPYSEYKGAYWDKVVEYHPNGSAETFKINTYFKEHSDHMMGNLKIVSSRHGDMQVLTNDTKLYSKAFDKMVNKFPANIYKAALDDLYLYEEDDMLDMNSLTKDVLVKYPHITSLKEDEYIDIDGKYYKTQRGKLLPIDCFGEKKESISLFVQLKEAYKDIVFNPALSDFSLSVKQANLHSKYDTFVSKYGYINDRKKCRNLKKFLSLDQYGYALVSCLEDFDENSKTYNKSAVFFKRVVGKPMTFKAPEKIEDAVNISYMNKGMLDIKYVSDIMDESENDIINSLKEKNKIFYNYKDELYEDDITYLSGYVKDKLEYCNSMFEAEIKLKGTEDYNELLVDDLRRNIEELKNVQPEDVVEEIKMSLSSLWIPIDIKKGFIATMLNRSQWCEDKETLDENIKLIYSSVEGYKLKIKGNVPYTLRVTEWGTKEREAESLLQSIMNNRLIEVRSQRRCPITGDLKSMRDPELTQAAILKAEKWVSAFENYVVENPEIYARLIKEYNSKMNRYVVPKMINLIGNPSINPNIKLRDHQLIGASRAIRDKSVLLQYSVGGGKTFTMVAAAQEMKRIHKSHGIDTFKSLIAVPKTLLSSGQFAREYLTLYPNANILAVTEDDFTPTNRRKILNKIMVNNWDAVIISHEMLGMIPLKPDTVDEFISEDEYNIEKCIAAYGDEGKHFSLRDQEKMKRSRVLKMKHLYDMKKDEYAVYFEDLQINCLIVDEAHKFKSLPIDTQMRITGISDRTSKRALDLYNKVRYLRKIENTKVVFSTATPVSNTMAEMHTFMKFLMEDILLEHGLETFDAWASVFGEIVSNVEIDVTGQNFQVKQSFSKFNNIPELMNLYRVMAHIVDVRDVENLSLPKLNTGGPIVESIQPTGEILDFIDDLVERVTKIQARTVKPEVDNMLNVVTDGRLLAVAPRLVGLDVDSPKLKKAAENIAKLYDEDNWSTQIVFCDLGTPTGTTHNTYDELKGYLLNNGVREEHIAYMQNANNSAKKKTLMAKFREGHIRVLIGSSSTCGEGCNIQDKLKALHHICAPWNASILEQREGRIVRQGNINEYVSVYRYVVENSFDSFSWQTIERKAKFISQMLKGSGNIRSMEDLDNQVLSCSEAKAAACGNKLVMEHCQVTHDLMKVNAEYKIFENNKKQSTRILGNVITGISYLSEELPKLKGDIAILKDVDISIPRLDVSGFEFRDIKSIKEMLFTVENGSLGTLCEMPIYLDSEQDLVFIGNSKLLKCRLYNGINTRYEEIMESIEAAEKTYTNFSQNLKNLREEESVLRESLDRTFNKIEVRDRLISRINELNKLIKEEKDERIEKVMAEELKESDEIA